MGGSLSMNHAGLYKARKLIEKLYIVNLDWCRHGKSQDALRIIRDNIFDEKTHFILELVQNADDCQSKEVFFKLEKNRLIVENTGTPFDEKNVVALSNIGRSTKNEDHIGFFGIGFKSVFQVTKVPEIHSAHYHFSYDDKNLIVPKWLENPDWESPLGSIFVLPLKPGKQLFREIKKQLSNFDGSVLFFLKHLKKIHVNNVSFNIEPFKASKNDFALFRNKKQSSIWKKYSAIIKIPVTKQKALQIDRGRRWSKKKREEISISFQVNEEGAPIVNRKGRLYAFFPTEIATGLSFNIQADFLVLLSRKTLQKARGEWNQWIFRNVYKSVAKLITDFKKTSNLKTTFYRLLPQKGDLTLDYLEIVKESIDKYIIKNPTVLTSTGKWVKPSQALIPAKGIPSLIETKFLKKIFNSHKYYISEDIDEDGMSFLKEHLQKFTFWDLLRRVCSKTNWIKNRPQKWFIKLYALLWDWVESYDHTESVWKNNALNQINKARIFLSESKKFMAVEGGSRRLYRLERQQTGYGTLFKNDYELFNQKLYARIFSDATKNPDEKAAREKAQQLIKKVIPTLSVEKILDDIIYPALMNWENNTVAKLFKYTDFIRLFAENPDPEKIFLRKEDNKKLYLECKKLFMSPEYRIDPTLSILFRKTDVPFVSKYYINTLLKRTSDRSKDQIASWRKFFRKIGVKEFPICYEIKKSKYGDELRKELKKYYPKKDLQNSNWSYQKQDSKFMQEFFHIIDSLQDETTPNRFEKAKLTARIINNNWSHYKKHLKSYYLYHVHGAHGRSDEILGPSAIAKTIKEKKWVPTLSGKIVRPCDVFLNLQLIKEAMGDQVEYVDGIIDNPSLIKFAEFNDKPSILAALNHLRGMINRKEKDYDAYRRSYIYFKDFLEDHKASVKDRDMVIKAFRSEPIIFVPDNQIEPYRRYSEVVWEGPSFIKNFKPNLEKYFDLKSFFVDIIGVTYQPTISDYANFLIYLSQKEKLNFIDQEAILSVYGKVDDALSDLDEKDSDRKLKTKRQQKIWQHLSRKGKIWCLDKTWASFSDDLYYNDNDHIYHIFKDTLKFIYLDFRKRPKLPVYFLNKFGIKSLRQAVQEIAPEIEEEIVSEANQDEIEKVISIVPYLRGFIKQRDPVLLEKISETTTFSNLASIKVNIVESIVTYYQVNGIQRPNPDNKLTFYNSHNNTLYLAGGLRDCEDDIGMCFSEVLGDVPGIVDFISRLISLDEIERQNVIQRRKIEWVDLDDSEQEDDTGSDEDQKIGDQDNGEKDKRPIKHRAKKTKPASPKISFNAQEFFQEVEPILDTISVKQVGEKELQEITVYGRPRSGRKGGGGLWSGLTDEQKKQIGTAAEKIVYYKEKIRLKKLFEEGIILQDLSEKVDYIAERDDSAGFDILSYDNNGKNIYIEVKGTSDEESMEFLISREEFKKAEEKGESYFICRVLNVKKDQLPSVVTIKNPFKLWRKNKLKLLSKKLLMIAKLE